MQDVLDTPWRLTSRGKAMFPILPLPRGIASTSSGFDTAGGGAQQGGGGDWWNA